MYRTHDTPLMLRSVAHRAEMQADGYELSAVLSSSRRDLMGDRILPGALKAWATENARKRMPMLREHQRALVLGEWFEHAAQDMDDGEVELSSRGEIIEELSVSRDAIELVKREILASTSIGFYYDDVRRLEAGWDIGAIDIVEASLVVWPANTDARIDLYRGDGTLDTNAVERALCEVLGLRASDADRMLSAFARLTHESRQENLIMESLS